MPKRPKISICVPAHKAMKNHDYFLARLKESVEMQTFKDYELIVTYMGKMAENSNAAMREATGEIVKILYLDDYFANDLALQAIVDGFKNNPTKQWLASACAHDDGRDKYLFPHIPSYSPDMVKGDNTIGSPSVVAIRRESLEFFDENLSWLLDCDLYYRLYEKHGAPIYVHDIGVMIGLGEHQTTNLMSDAEKLQEFNYLRTKYGY